MRFQRLLQHFLATCALASIGLAAEAAAYKCKDADGNWTEAACKGTPAAPPSSSTSGSRSSSPANPAGPATPTSHAVRPPPEWDPSWTGAGPKPRIECEARCFGCADGQCESLGDAFSMDVSREKAYEKLVLGCDWKAREQWHKTSSELRFRLSDEHPAEPPGFVMGMDSPLVCIGGEGNSNRPR